MIGRENMFQSKTNALREVYRHLDYSICRECKLRVFIECARLGKQEPREDDDEVAPAGDAHTTQQDRNTGQAAKC